MRSPQLSRFAFFAAATFLVFLVGFVASHFGFFPAALLRPALDQARQVFTGEGRKLHHRAVARHDLEGAHAYAADGTRTTPEVDPEAPGVVLLTSYWPESGWLPGIRVIDRGGAVLHHWDVDLDAIWPESPYDDGAEVFYGDENYVHGSYLFENGDVLFNVEYRGLVRMNAAGEVVWRLDRHTHHSVTRDDDGNFWVCDMRWITDIQEALTRFFGLIPPFTEDRVLKVSPDGEVLDEISLLEIVHGGEFRTLLWRAGPHAPTRTIDPLHLNDVDPLPAAIADRYPTFAAGDLAVSLYQPNLVFVFDPKTRAVKWWRIASLVHQHDPDWTGDGWITVFNNRADGTPDGAILGGSELIAFEPATGAMRRIYPAADGAPADRERRFYTAVGGKAQPLPNGHWLLTEAVAGRVFEVDARGRTVWEWGQQRHADGRMISEVLEGTWYPFSPQQVRAWSAR